MESCGLLASLLGCLGGLLFDACLFFAAFPCRYESFLSFLGRFFAAFLCVACRALLLLLRHKVHHLLEHSHGIHGGRWL